MKSAIVHLVGTSPYSQGKHYSVQEVPKVDNGKESADAYERRTWRHRMHVMKDGRVEIPGGAFANSLKESAKRLKLQVPGKGRTEYTKFFEAGVMVPDSLPLPVKAEEVPHDELFVPSDGRRGGGKRVTKLFPRIDQWEGDVVFYIFDDIITEDVFQQVLVAAGQLVGIGRFRPERCGYYGRFMVKSIKWLDEAATMQAMGGAA
jgi:hypothetical protein